VRKIKNFKVNLRVKEISRVVRKLINIADMSMELEETVQRCCRSYAQCLAPSVIYETFSKEALPVAYEQNAPVKWIAESVFFVTIGNSLCEEYKKNEGAFGEYTDKIVSALAVDALEQSKNFVQRLIFSEAQEENCEISRVVDIQKDLYNEFAKFIPIDKIGVSVEYDDINLKYLFCGLFYWIPSKKKTKK
jgi:hypothetical protein